MKEGEMEVLMEEDEKARGQGMDISRLINKNWAWVICFYSTLGNPTVCPQAPYCKGVN